MVQKKLQTLKGFRDFLPAEKKQREYVIGKIKAVFEKYGFDPIETPTLEYASVLLGKYGKEADNLMYIFKDHGQRDVGLRYDQTVPTARFLAQHLNEVPKFLRRYQIQNVFRAENTQSGRYREFLQCDCDIFGSTSEITDAEILTLFCEIYNELGLKNIKIYINDREILVNTLKKYETQAVNVFSIIASLDKLDKIGKDGVVYELLKKGIEKNSALNLIDDIFNIKESEALKKIIQKSIELGASMDQIIFKPTLARGLNYYTNLIFESALPELNLLSLGGGGRYNNLISDLGGPQIAAVGFALGFDRIIEVLRTLNLIPDFLSNEEVLVTIFSDQLVPESLRLAKTLRENNFKVSVYPELSNISKQLKYASENNVKLAVILGDDELKNNTVTVKDLRSRNNITINKKDLVSKIKEII